MVIQSRVAFRDASVIARNKSREGKGAGKSSAGEEFLAKLGGSRLFGRFE
jgi:hypothetical protein